MVPETRGLKYGVGRAMLCRKPVEESFLASSQLWMVCGQALVSLVPHSSLRLRCHMVLSLCASAFMWPSSKDTSYTGSGAPPTQCDLILADYNCSDPISK